MAYLFNGPFVRVDNPSTNDGLDTISNGPMYSFRSALEQRILANKCEWCNTESGVFEVHHVRKLKDLKGKMRWEKMMIARQRKSMVLCKQCHVDLHAGRLD